MRTKKTGQSGKSRQGSEWIYGLNPVLETIRAKRKIKEIYVSATRKDSPKVAEIKKEAEKKNIPLIEAEKSFFNLHFPKGHQGIAAKVLPKSYIALEELLEIPLKRKEPPLFIIVDCIEDPRNLGSILRVADAAGIHGVVIQSHRSTAITSTVLKVSAGAAEYVPVSMVANIKHAIRKMKEKGITVVGAEAEEGNLLWDLDLKVPLALVIGSEGKGLRKTVKESCNLIVSIPMKGRINSLNVAVATGVLVYEILRQRNYKF